MRLKSLSFRGGIGRLTLQVATGPFTNDDIAFTGPLSDLVTKGLSKRLSDCSPMRSTCLPHHVGPLILYVHARKRNLVRLMVTGLKEDGEGESARGRGNFALVVALPVAAVQGASRAWLLPPTCASAARAAGLPVAS